VAEDRTTLHDFTATSITGEPQKLSEYAGKVALVVNVASLAGKGLPSLGPTVWVASGIALAAGLGAGELVSRRLGAARGLQLVIAVALAGGIATVVRGLAEL